MLPPAAEVGAPRLSVTGVLVPRKARKGLWGCWQGSLFRPSQVSFEALFLSGGSSWPSHFASVAPFRTWAADS